ncbi:MAG: ribbon-helix-helix protein, CopG family [Acidimicrobiia bacterium]|nr:ribbon-helix-helix protein, CopG family [Acidimicrobiia bacterium]
MVNQRRTTVTASNEALRTLEAEAQRRGVPVSVILREILEEKAHSLRAGRRPRVAVGRSTDGASAADLASEPVAEPPR